MITFYLTTWHHIHPPLARRLLETLYYHNQPFMVLYSHVICNCQGLNPVLASPQLLQNRPNQTKPPECYHSCTFASSIHPSSYKIFYNNNSFTSLAFTQSITWQFSLPLHIHSYSRTIQPQHTVLFHPGTFPHHIYFALQYLILHPINSVNHFYSTVDLSYLYHINISVYIYSKVRLALTFHHKMI